MKTLHSKFEATNYFNCLRKSLTLVATGSFLLVSLGACTIQTQQSRHPTDIVMQLPENSAASSLSTATENLSTSNSSETTTPSAQEELQEKRKLSVYKFEKFDNAVSMGDASSYWQFAGSGMLLYLPEKYRDHLSIHERQFKLDDELKLPFIDIIAKKMLTNKAESDYDDLALLKPENLLLARIFKMADNLQDAHLARFLWRNNQDYEYHFLQNGVNNYLLLMAKPNRLNKLHKDKVLDEMQVNLTLQEIKDGLFSVGKDFRYKNVVYLLENLEQPLSFAPYSKLLDSSNSALLDSLLDGNSAQKRQEFSLALPYVPEALAPVQLDKDSIELALPLTENYHNVYRQAQQLLIPVTAQTGKVAAGQQNISQLLHLPLDLALQNGDVVLRLHYAGQAPVIHGKAAGKLYSYYRGGKKDGRERVLGVPYQFVEDLKTLIANYQVNKGLDTAPQMELYVPLEAKAAVDFVDFAAETIQAADGKTYCYAKLS